MTRVQRKQVFIIVGVLLFIIFASAGCENLLHAQDHSIKIEPSIPNQAPPKNGLIQEAYFAMSPDRGQMVKWEPESGRYVDAGDPHGTPMAFLNVTSHEQWVAVHNDRQTAESEIRVCKDSKCEEQPIILPLQGIDLMVGSGKWAAARSGEVDAQLRNRIALLDVTTHQLHSIVQVPGVVQQMVAAEHGQFLLLSTDPVNGTRQIYRIDPQQEELQKLVLDLEKNEMPAYIQYDADRHMLYSVIHRSTDEAMWYVRKDQLSDFTFRMLSKSEAISDQVTSFLLNPNGSRIAIGTSDGQRNKIRFQNTDLKNQSANETNLDRIPQQLTALSTCVLISNDEQKQQQCISWDDPTVTQNVTSDQILWF